MADGAQGRRVDWKWILQTALLTSLLEEIQDGYGAEMLRGNKRGKTEGGGAATLAGKNWVTGGYRVPPG